MEIRTLNPSESDLINRIASWYFSEWNAPLSKTIAKLSSQPNDDVLFQLIAMENSKIVASGGLCYNVNILNVHPNLSKYGPWISSLYTDPEYRGKGIGKALLDSIEDRALSLGLKQVYLYTFTAETLYARNGWKVIDRVAYKGHDTTVMTKKIS